MKAIILTYAPISDEERDILKRTDIFKLALNQHSKDLNPHARIITDYILLKVYKSCPERIISVREKFKFYSSRVEYPEIEFKGSTIIAAADYLISKNYDEILIVGDNKVNSVEFRNKVNEKMDIISSEAKIFQYTNGNFNLPVRKIADFAG